MSSDTYSEDLESNLRLVQALAPIHCTACNGYHLARARKRLVAPDALDRADIVHLIQDRIARHGASAPFEVLIAGAGDSNLLAMAAEAVAGAAPARYTVLDRCRTPLAVCESYAREWGLPLATRQVDMAAPEGIFAADLVVVHSLLRFLPQHCHAGVLSALRRWLTPGGAMIFSQRLVGSEGSEPYHCAEYETAEPILALFASAGLRVVSEAQFREENGPRRRLLALLEAG